MDKMIDFSNEILSASISSLSGEFVYFAYPLGLLNFRVENGVNKAVTNGKSAVVDAKYLIESTAKYGLKEVGTTLLHVTLHCLFTHPFKRVENCLQYDLASDIVVGYILDGLGYAFGEKIAQNKRKAVYKSIFDEFGGVTDLTVNKFCDKMPKDEIESLSKIFTLCDHSAWAGREPNLSGDEQDGESPISLAFQDDSEEDIESLLSEWKAFSQSLIPQIGKLNPELKKVLSVSVMEKSDYKSFLRKFLRRRERILTSEDEFDYIAYYYGLKTYGNVPLIEALETSDSRDYSEIAIAIDTSGSTDGEPVKKLLSEVFSLLKSMESGSKKYAVRILQCDLKIQKEDLVKSADEFLAMLDNYKLIGGGGTDFTPVFNYLTELKRKGRKIEGLIYFTDGVGVYPMDIPPFKTCFAILGENEEVDVPHFAYKIKIEV